MTVMRDQEGRGIEELGVCSRSAQTLSGGLEPKPPLLASPLPYLSVSLLQL